MTLFPKRLSRFWPPAAIVSEEDDTFVVVFAFVRETWGQGGARQSPGVSPDISLSRGACEAAPGNYVPLVRRSVIQLSSCMAALAT